MQMVVLSGFALVMSMLASPSVGFLRVAFFVSVGFSSLGSVTRTQDKGEGGEACRFWQTAFGPWPPVTFRTTVSVGGCAT